MCRYFTSSIFVDIGYLKFKIMLIACAAGLCVSRVTASSINNYYYAVLKHAYLLQVHYYCCSVKTTLCSKVKCETGTNKSRQRKRYTYIFIHYFSN